MAPVYVLPADSGPLTIPASSPVADPLLPALQELSASILLFSSESITLAVAVYNLYETGYLEPVAALAIVTMVIITIAIGLATRLGRGSPAVGRPSLAQ